MNYRPVPSTIEALEDRIAPAGVNDLVIAFNGKTATYTDGDGDKVTVKITQGTLAPANFTLVPGVVGSDLAILDLSAAGFTDSNLTITAKKSKTAGDGKAHVGFLNAGTHDLGTVQIPGDLSDLLVGDSAGTVLKSLTVQSVGVVDLAGALRAGFPTLDIAGDVGKIIVKGDVSKAWIQVRFDAGSVSIGGSLIGGNADFSGAVTFEGDCDSVKIGGDLIGAAGAKTGYVQGANLGSVTVDGSLLGGSGLDNTGRITASQSIDAVKIGGSVIGGTTTFSGGIGSNGNIGKVTIAGDLVGSVVNSGYVIGAKLGTVKIGGAVKGGSGDFSGRIQSSSTIDAVSVGGDIVGGAGKQSGQILSTESARSVAVKGSLLGGGGVGTGSIVVNLTTDGISGSVKIGGDVRGGAGELSGRIESTMGSLTSVKINGSVIGDVGDFSGSVSATKDLASVKIGGEVSGGVGGSSGRIHGGTLASVKINGSLTGAAGIFSGSVTSPNNLGLLQIGGDLSGAGGESSGRIEVGSLTTLKINGSLIGAAGNFSGLVSVANDAGSVKINGSATGNTGEYSGSISVGNSLRSLQIGRDVVGGAGSTAGSIVVNGAASGISGPITIGGDLRGAGGVFSGLIWSIEGSLQAVTIKGSAITGMGGFSGSILAGNNLGSVKIMGDVTGTAANNFIIRAGGNGVAIGSLQVGGTVTHTQVLAGFGLNNDPVNGGVEIGKVTVGRDWVASSISAGFTAGGDGKFGTTDDTRINAGQLGLVPRIASITIKGAVSGTPAAGDHFGFVAREIGSMKIGKTKVALTTGTDVIDVSGGTTDVFVREVP